ncbi:hypothetical protein B0T26DRAFT_761457 [Lasiosphaeria miniovina]|uniref:DUF7624 domain-containing protein n=1 Tax=Lasiosphaeria miniovina TaxID=1954250 RepID=A0AA40BHL4_9PEZI|nr:uncharacterized protein B0T26DRAFT_761457 [Lasiosphaeria miniovina]KAK0734335.1 hypothetical protein B0T26DRAFT_761457 [Lasiosphaeria miniovina]
MALEAPLRTSTGSITSTYSPHADMSLASGPESPALSSQYMASSSGPDSQSLRPNSFSRPGSNHLMSPSSDIVGPSPVTSNGTETTEIEDEIAEGHTDEGRGPAHGHPSLMMLRTNLPDHIRKSVGEEIVSVIHAPQSFQNWKSSDSISRSSLSNSVTGMSAEGTISPPLSEHSTVKSPPPTHIPPSHFLPMVNTKVKPVPFGLDTATPQAQKLEDVFANEPSKLRSSTASSLECMKPQSSANELTYLPDADEEYEDADEFSTTSARAEDSEVKALRAALEECWTLCNTLANLSSIHRERVFNSSGTPDAHEKAWKCCWKLCKRLYTSRDDLHESYNVRTNLDLCRDFCQALFDVRQRKEEVADSILRVSFELNNHLYSAQDSRNLPEAFRERTLDFYITLCHRLMKQRNELAEETDSLLRACWSLAEMLFSLRQNRRDNKAPDEELLGSAVQACWELCDIFREGWTQIRPDRGTPRPSQVNFFSSGHPSDIARSGAGSRASLHSKRESLRKFEDTPISPDASPQMPNIIVLGTSLDSRSDRGGERGRWSSNASNLSGYSQNSQQSHHTSSTATTATASIEDLNVTRIKTLIVKAAMNIGFSRDAAAADTLGGASSLQAFVKSLPTGSFGSLPSHATLLQSYKNLVLADATFRASASLPTRGKRVNALDIAKSVNWMMIRSSQYSFLRDLFKLVFGFQLDDAETRKSVSIAI